MKLTSSLACTTRPAAFAWSAVINAACVAAAIEVRHRWTEAAGAWWAAFVVCCVSYAVVYTVLYLAGGYGSGMLGTKPVQGETLADRLKKLFATDETARVRSVSPNRSNYVIRL
jgi:hypothetical protein